MTWESLCAWVTMVRWYIPVLLFIPVSACISQKLQFKTLREDLFDGHLNCLNIHEDRYGFIWFATMDGVYKYDGYRATKYSSDPHDSLTINHNFITDILEEDDILYLSAWGNGPYINKINLRTNHVSRMKIKGNPNNGHNRLMNLEGGTLIASGNAGLVSYNRETGKSHFTVLGRNKLLWRDEQNIIWVSRSNELLGFGYYGDSLQLRERVVVTASVTCMEHIGSKLIFGNSKGLHFKDFREEVPKVLSALNISCLKNDSYNRLWIGTRDSGLYCWDIENDSILHFEGKNQFGSLPVSEIHAIYEDSRHILWIGTSEGPFYTSLAPNAISSINFPDSFRLFNNTGPMLVEDNERLYMADKDHVYFYDLKKGKFASNRLPIKNVTSIAADRIPDRYWVGTMGFGAYYLGWDRKSERMEILRHFKRVESEKSGVSDDRAWSIFQDKQGNVWIGTYSNGVDILCANNQWVHVDTSVLGAASISCIMQVRDGSIWIATLDNGLIQSYFDGNEICVLKRYLPENSDLKYLVITDLYEDDSGDLWIATFGGGLYRKLHSKERFEHYSTKNSLGSNALYSLQKDKDGGLWCSTTNGLAYLRRGSNRFRVFKTGDGVVHNNFSFFSEGRTASGILFFGTERGIAVVHPDRLLRNEKPYKPVIAEVNLFHKRLFPGPKSLIGENANLLDTLILPFDQDILTFEFANHYYKEPQSVYFSYILEGFDEQWNNLGKHNLTTFTRLPHGTYRLHVRSSIDGGYSFTSMDKPLILIILPPWYKTWWFRILWVSTMVYFGYWLIRQRTRKLLAKQRFEMEKLMILEKERSRISRDMHDDLGSGLSAINLMSNYLKDRAQEKYPEFSQDLDKIHNSSSELNQRIREIIWTTSTKDDNFSSLVLFISNYCHELEDKLRKSIKIESPDPLPDVELSSEQRKHAFLSVKEAINNAVKHGKAQSILVRAQCSGKMVIIKVRDDGAADKHGKIPGNHGKGLDNMKSRMKELGGEMSVNKHSSGMEIILTFPI